VRKQDITVSSLVDMIERGGLQLPEIQRRYVWRAPRVRDLLDSLYRGYPSGSILVWETTEEAPARQLQVHASSAPGDALQKLLLLDGQQRLTSLAAVIQGRPIHVRNRKKPIEILFNLEHPEGSPLELVEVVDDEDSPLEDADETSDSSQTEEESDDEAEEALQAKLQRRTFVVASKSLEVLPNWVRVSDVFRSTSDADILPKTGVESFKDPRYARYTERLRKLREIKNYPYVMHILGGEHSYEEVAEIFVRVNSLGVKLRSSDLALAQITARWPNSLRLLEEFQEKCEESWFTLDLGLLVRAMVVFASKQAKFASVASIRTERLQEAWGEAKRGLEFAIDFLRTNAGIEDESLLSSPFLMIPIAVASRLRENRFSGQEVKDLLYWLLVANAKGRYSRGSSETLLNEDLAALFRGEPIERLIETLRLQFGRLHVEAADLVGRTHRSPLFSLGFLALRAAGAKDWHSGLGISLAHQGRLHYVQFHHIFPKSILKARYEKAAINEIANLAFISGDTNRRLGNKEPAVYFPGIVEKHGEEVLTSQAIPMHPGLREVGRFAAFLDARRQNLATMINAHLEHARR
jgi:hypothetical protein